MKTSHLTKSQYIICVAFTLLSAYWFGLFSVIPQRWDAMPTYDSVFFIKLAENIVRFKEFGWISYHEPCSYPLLTDFLSIFTDDLYFSAVIISKAAMVILPAVVYLFARDIFSERVGIGAALLILFFPHMRVISGTAQSEALYVLLITCSVGLLWKAWRQASLRMAVTAGVFFSVAYLTRSKAIFVTLFLVAYLVVLFRSGEYKRSGIRIAGTVLITFTILCAPYIGYLSAHYGSLTIGTKTSGIYFWVRDKCFHDPDPERAEWGLSPHGELNLISMKFRDLMAYWGKDIPRSISVYLENFTTQISGRIPNDGAIKHYPQVYPLYLAVPLLVGLVLLYRRRRVFTPAGRVMALSCQFVTIFSDFDGSGFLMKLRRFFRDKKSRVIFVASVMLVTAYHVWIVAWQPVPGPER